ncbi:MAG: serine protease [Thermodesulfobacteriota bacterium]
MIALPSRQAVLIEMAFEGNTLATGTGFFIRGASGSDYLLTNRHNVTGRDQVTGECISKNGGIPNEIVVHFRPTDTSGAPTIQKKWPLLDGDRGLWVEHPMLGDKADFVALQIKVPEEAEFHPFDPSQPGDEILIEPAEPVSVVGFPFGLIAGKSFPVWATGFIATDPEIDFDDLPVVLIDCRTRQGQSGSPVVAYRAGGAFAQARGTLAVADEYACKFLGIYSGRINRESDLGKVWKAAAICQLAETL